MPYVNIQVTAGITREQKRALVRSVTQSVGELLGKKPEHTHVVIQEIEDANWGFCGQLTDEWRSRPA